MFATTLAAITFLLLAPGFLAVQIIEWLAPVRIREAAMKEKITTALTLSLLNYLIYLALSSWPLLSIEPLLLHLGADKVGLPAALTLPFYNVSIGSLAWILGISLTLGIFAAWTLNQGWLFKLLNKAHISYSTGRASVWFDAFRETENSWAKVYLDDGTVVLGYISSYSDDPTNAMLLLSRVRQNVDGQVEDQPVNVASEKQEYSTDVKGPGVLLVAPHIKRIEFWD